MVRPIVRAPAAVLQNPSAEVTDPRAREIVRLIADLHDTCVAAHGIGLAAPQLGLALRVAVIRLSDRPPYAIINPEIVASAESATTLEEGCLSLPDTLVAVTRPRKVRVRSLNARGETVEITAVDLQAKVLQHEIDHLNGILITAHATTSANE